jgi:hypothetical protein
VQCTHAFAGHHRQARVGSQSGRLVSMGTWLEPQNGHTLGNRGPGNRLSLRWRAEHIDYVDGQIHILQRVVRPLAKDLAASRVHREDPVPL